MNAAAVDGLVIPTMRTASEAGPTPRRFTISLPAGMSLLNANGRLHHHKRAKLTSALRGAAMRACSENPALRTAIAVANPRPVLHRAHIVGIVHPTRRGRCDPANWYPSFKSCVDGLVDARVLEDDDFTRLVGPDMRLGPVVKTGKLVLHVREILTDSQWNAAQQISLTGSDL